MADKPEETSKESDTTEQRDLVLDTVQTEKPPNITQQLHLGMDLVI